jgi:hypothetical protein
MSASKNPFEIRLELLQMAQKHLDDTYAANLEFARKAFDAALAANKVTFEQWQTYAPKPYSMAEIMEKATELYGFVSRPKISS